MGKCKIHWSVFSCLICALAVTLFTVAIITPNWAHATLAKYEVNTGLFLTCQNLNDTCSYTHVHFDGEDAKSGIMASAVLNLIADVGMWFFFILAVLYLCGLFDDDSLVTISVIMAYSSAAVGMVGTALFSIHITSMGYSLRWSFLLAVVGMLLIVVAGILMCVGRNVVTTEHNRLKLGFRSNQKKKSGHSAVEELQMGDMGRANVWATGDGD